MIYPKLTTIYPEDFMKNILMIFVLIICVSAYAGPNKFKEVDLKIMDYLYNADVAKAESLLTVQISQDSNNPKYFLIKSHYHFYSRYFSQGLVRDSILQLIVKESQKTIELAEKMDDSPMKNFYIGSAYGFLSRALVMQQEYWDGYWAARDCRNHLEDALDEDPSLADAYIGLGMIEYFTGLRYTGFYNFLVWFVGMSGEREKGIEYFTNAYEDGELFKNEAHFILGTVNRFMENDYSQAINYYESYLEKFPNNNFVETQYHQANFMNLINDKGVEFLETEFDSLKTKYSITNSGTLNGLGYTYIGQQRLDEALVIFKTNVKLFPSEANMYDSLAECYLTMENTDMAIKNYKTAWQKLESDTTINDNLREVLRTGIPERLEELGSEVDVQT